MQIMFDCLICIANTEQLNMVKKLEEYWIVDLWSLHLFNFFEYLARKKMQKHRRLSGRKSNERSGGIRQNTVIFI